MRDAADAVGRIDDAAASDGSPSTSEGSAPGRSTAETAAHRWPALDPLRRAWPWLRVVLSFALAGIALWVVYDRGSELQASRLEHLRWIWLLPALAVEGASLLCFAFMQRRLLKVGKVEAPQAPLAGVTFATQAISNSFPGGAALAAVYSFRWYRRFGADESLAAWTLVGVLVAASLSLSLVAAGGVALAADASADLGLVPVVVGVLVLSIGMALLFVKQEWVLSFLRRLVHRRQARRVARANRSDGGEAPSGARARERRRGVDLSRQVVAVLHRLEAFRLGWRGLAAVVGWGLGTWLLDCACFALAFWVVRAPIPWGALLLAYGAGQLAANLPITPGGLGVVEGSIEAALVLFGGAKHGGIVDAVFIYRLISFWLELVVGWSAAGVLALGVRRGRWSIARDVAPAMERPESEARTGPPGGDADVPLEVGER